MSNDDEIRAAIIRDAISRAGLHKPEEGKNRDQAPGAAFGFDEHHTPSELARAEHAASQLGACEAKSAQQGIEDRIACDPSASANTTLPPYLYHFFSAPQCRDHTGGGDFTFASQLETVPAAPQCSQALNDASCRSIAQQAPAQPWLETVPAAPQFSQALNDASCRSIAQQAPAQPWPTEDVALPPLEAELVSLRAALALSAQREESSFQMLKALRIQLHKAYRMIALQQRDLFSSDPEITPFSDSPESAFLTQHW
jgi:hypothetical protein